MADPTVSLCVLFRTNASTLPTLLASISDPEAGGFFSDGSQTSATPNQPPVGWFDDTPDQKEGTERGHSSNGWFFSDYTFCDTRLPTDPDDGSRALVSAFLETHPGRIVSFPWCDDFAAARRACFEAATGDWRMFLDSDDTLHGGQHVRSIVRELHVPRFDPSTNRPTNATIDVAYFRYGYGTFDRYNMPRLFRWRDRNWTWRDPLHEELVRDPPVNPADTVFVPPERVWVQHAPKKGENMEATIERNDRIARAGYESADPNDARLRAKLAKTIASTHKFRGEFERAQPWLEEIASYEADPSECRRAHADLCLYDVRYADPPRWSRASHRAKRAGFPYETLVWSERARRDPDVDLQRAHDLCLSAWNKASAETKYTAYDTMMRSEMLFETVAAPVRAADAALALRFPPRAIESVLNTVRSDLRCALEDWDTMATVEKLRDAIDRITILVARTPCPFDPDSPQTGFLGGSEEAVVCLAKALAKSGRNVRVFCPMPSWSDPVRVVSEPTWESGVPRGELVFRSVDAFRPEDEHGTVVVWRYASVVAQIVHARATQLRAQIESGSEDVVVPSGIRSLHLWMHDAATDASGEDLRAVFASCASVSVLSKHHRRVLGHQIGSRADPCVRFVRVPNGLDSDSFRSMWADSLVGHAPTQNSPARDPHKVVYTSCPARGLRCLFQAWPRIRDAVPDATLDVFYDWSGVRIQTPDVFEDLRRRAETLAERGVTIHGGVSHPELHRRLFQASVWAYPHVELTSIETFCISALKARAAGCSIVTTPHGALPETLEGLGASFVSCPDRECVAEAGAVYPESIVEAFANAVIEAMRTPETEDDRARYAKKTLETWDWSGSAREASNIWRAT